MPLPPPTLSPAVDPAGCPHRQPGVGRERLLRQAVAALVVMSGLAACVPALDWRELTLPGSGLHSLFPCRPVPQQREVTLAGTAVAMTLHACEAAGSTFAVAVADVADPALVGPALRALRETSAGKLGPATAQVASAGWPVAGMTPQADAARLSWAGLPGQPANWQVDSAWFARGTWVVQASVLGPVAAEARANFFESLGWPP